MTGVAGAEDIEDGLAAPRRPPPKHFNESHPRHLMCLVLTV